jgi:transcriptional regulator with XRE-family HTH domain
MAGQNLSNSALARRIWGTTKDARGYDVSRNRDRISAYLSGDSLPNRDTRPKLAAALGLTEVELFGVEPLPPEAAKPAREVRPPVRTPSREVQVVVTVTIGVEVRG